MHALMTSTAMALVAGLTLAVGTLPAAAQQQQQTMAVCDQDDNGYVSADEARACAERDWSALVGDEESMSRERFDETFADADNLEEMWAAADADQDGVITNQEWADWRDQRFNEASQDADQGMPVDAYDAMAAEYHLSDDEQGAGETPNTGGGGAGGSGGTGGGSSN